MSAEPNARSRCRRGLVAVLTGFVFLLSPASGLTQETPAEGDAAAGTENEADASPLERLIYLPYRNLKEVFEKHGSTVFMPYSEYLKLWEKTEAPGPKAVEGVITEAHYSASVDKSLLRIKAELTVRVLGKPWVEIPVAFGRAAVGKLTADKEGQVLLRGTGDGQYALLFGEAGEHKVTLELAAAITTSPDGRTADFSVPPVGVTTFELAIPETDQTVEVSPQLVGLPVNAAAGETRIKANLGSTTRISARWHPRTSQKPDMDLLASVSNLQKVSLRDGLVHTDAWLDYDVLRGEMTQLAIAVPLGQRILGVTSPNSKIRGWKKVDEADRQTVTVEFLSPVKDKVTIEVHTEREFSATAIDVAGRDEGGRYLGIHSVDAVRESGQITVVAASDLSLQFEQVKDLSRIEDDKVAEQIREAGAASFKFYSPNVRLSVLAKPVEPRLQVNSNYAFEISDDELQLNSTLDYTIERAGIFEVSLNLPDGLEVDSVTGTSGNDESFRMANPAEQRIANALASQSAVNFVDTPLVDGLQFLAQQHSIPIVVEQIAMDDAGIPGDEPINLKVSGISLRNVMKLMFQDLQLTYVIENEVLKITTVDVAQERRLALGVSAVREHHVEGESPRVLRIVLHRKTAADSTLQIQIKSHTSFQQASDSVELTLPIPVPLKVEREQAQVQLVAEDALEVSTDQDAVVGAQPMPLAAGSVSQGRRVAAAWTFNRRPVEIPISTKRRPTRLTASVGTTATVKEEIVEVATQLTYDVQYAGVDTFRFAVPEAVSKGLQITSQESGSAPAIKQKVAAEEAEDGWITWTVTMQRDVTGRHRFQVTWDLKPESGGEGAAANSSTATIQTLRVLGLTEDNADAAIEISDVLGEIVVQKDRSLSVSATKLDDGLEVIDVRELSLLPQSGALAYRYYVKSPVGIKVDATKHEIQKVVETVVMKSLVEVVARRELTAAYRCRYWLKSSERQRLRIDIPTGSDLLGVFVDGKQVSPEKNSVPVEEEGWDSYFINVARTNNSDEPFGLTIQMLTPVSAGRIPFDGWLSGLVLRMPQIGGLDRQGVASQETQTIVWVPEDYWLLGDPDNFVNRSRLDLETAISLVDPRAIKNQEWMLRGGSEWIGIGESGFIDFPTEGTPFVFTNLGGAKSITVTWASTPRYTWLFSGALVLIALLMRRIPWDHKLLTLVLLAFVITLAGLSFPGWIPAVVSVMKYGLYALVGIWVLQAVFSWRATTSLPPDSESGVSLAAAGGPPAVVPPPGVFDDLRERHGK